MRDSLFLFVVLEEQDGGRWVLQLAASSEDLAAVPDTLAELSQSFIRISATSGSACLHPFHKQPYCNLPALVNQGSCTTLVRRRRRGLQRAVLRNDAVQALHGAAI